MKQQSSSARGIVLAGILAALLSGCTATNDVPGSASQAIPIEQAEHGLLRIFMTDQLTDGRVIKLRGKLINPYDESIEGIRMIYIDFGPGDPPRVLAAKVKIIEQTIEAGTDLMFRWDVESMYLGNAGTRFQLLAYAIKRGGRDLPPPPGWEAGDDDAARSGVR